MKYVKTYESLASENTMSSDDIIDYIKSLTPSDSDRPDYFLSLIKKSGTPFTLKTLKIADVLEMDNDLKDYVESGEIRYGEDGESDLEPHEEELDQPIVIFNNEVIDGYSRTSTLYHRGEETIQAWVSK